MIFSDAAFFFLHPCGWKELLQILYFVFKITLKNIFCRNDINDVLGKRFTRFFTMKRSNEREKKGGLILRFLSQSLK